MLWYHPGKPRVRQPKVPKLNVDSGGVINISDDSSSDSEGMDTDSNSSPDSLENDDVIFVNHTSCQTGKTMPLSEKWFTQCVTVFIVVVPLGLWLMLLLFCVHSEDRGDETGPPL